ncbi:hypothetical protein I4F81_007906 [Pyropia yezoensis]|uniref:Uncharacterized protein n=1 Tax=Pyropia yezoensis TaxID=2788 RepID=A0ACC3C607_PYRYE|nr:hypothetical protein I4F81_007906 [Neopyropia yezoensis]
MVVLLGVTARGSVRPSWATAGAVRGGGRGPSRRALARACASGDCARRACAAGGWAPVAYNDTGGLLAAAGARPAGWEGEAPLVAAAWAAVAPVAGGGRWGAFPPLPSFARRQRFLVVTHPEGGFNNRLIAVKNALLLGAATGRGVVVVDGRSLGGAYDLSALFPGGAGEAAGQAGGVPLPRVTDNSQVVAALTRVSRAVGGDARGGPAHAWHWPGGDDDSGSGSGSGRSDSVPPCVAAAAADEYLALPQAALYYACPPPPVDGAFYARLAPAPPLAAATAAAAAATAAASGLRPATYAAAHVRSLEGTCASRAAGHASPAAVTAAGRMCRVDPALVAAVVAASLRDGTAAAGLVNASAAAAAAAAAAAVTGAEWTSASPPKLLTPLPPPLEVFLAWDGQGWWRRRVRALRAAPWSILLSRQARVAAAAAAAAEATPGGWGGGTDLDRARVEELLAVRSGLFIGNPASSLTGNVVRLRAAAAAVVAAAGAGRAAGGTGVAGTGKPLGGSVWGWPRRGTDAAGGVGDCVVERYFCRLPYAPNSTAYEC